MPFGQWIYNGASKHRKVPVSDPLPYGDLAGVAPHIRAWKPPECMVSDFGASKQRVVGSNPTWGTIPSFFRAGIGNTMNYLNLVHGTTVIHLSLDIR